jgi:VWFA-related protein
MAGKSRQLIFLPLMCSIALASTLPGAFAQSDGSIKLRVDVELATTEVFALDKKGTPVRNLKKEDFELYEDGKRQEILSIDEVNADSEGASLGTNPIAESTPYRGKTVLIVFDDSSILTQYIKVSRESARKFVREYMRPQDLFAIAVHSTSMKVLQNFTGNREEVLGAIEQLAGTMGTSGGLYFESLLRALEQINYSITRIKGPKTVLIYSQPSSSSAPDSPSIVAGVRGRGPGAKQNPAAFSPGTPDIDTVYARVLGSARNSDVIFYTVDPGESRGEIPTGISLRSLTSATGGSFFDGGIESELEKLDQRISNYYVLGFQSNNPKHDGAFRKLEIRTELKGVTLKHSPGYQDRRPIDVSASAKQEQTLLTEVASPGNALQLPILFRPAYFYDSPRGARVVIAARIRMDKTAFKKKGGQLGTDLNIMGAAYAEDGSIAARFSETLPITFDREKEPKFRKGTLVYRNYFKLRPGKYRLKLAISDESGNLGSMEQFLDLPALPERGFAGSSIVIAEQTSGLSDLIRNVQTQLLDESDPLLCPGIQIEPSVENRLKAGSAVPLMFRLYNLYGPSDHWNVTAKAKLVDEKGKEYASGLIPVKQAMVPFGKSEAVVAMSLSFQNVPPGKYRLILETSEMSSAQYASLQTDLEFVF